MTFKNLVWGCADGEFLSSYAWASLCLRIDNVGYWYPFVLGHSDSELTDGWKVAREGKLSEISPP